MPETLETAAAVTPAAAPRLPRDARYYDTKREIEEFLYDEANLLDERRFQEWLGTLADAPPQVDVHFADSGAKTGGIGEPASSASRALESSSAMSRKITSAPWRANAHAVVTPITPPPSTATFITISPMT